MMDFMKAHKEDIPNLSMMTIFVAAMVRMISQRPALNRFVVHNKLYAHNSITISIAIKRTMSDDGEETMIKPSFDPRDTLQDVQRRLDEAIAEAINHEEGTGIDGVAGLLGKLPAWLFRFAVSMIHFLDNRGWLPEKLVQASPWHCSTARPCCAKPGCPMNTLPPRPARAAAPSTGRRCASGPRASGNTR